MMDERLFSNLKRSFGDKIGYACGVAAQNFVSTGIPQLDAATGGGIPMGQIVEIHGAEGSGKTALALHLARCLPGPTLYVDADCGLSPYILNLNGQDLYLLRLDVLEDVLQVCLMAAADGFGSIVIDTVAALPTREDLRCRLEDHARTYPAARRLSRVLPVLSQRIHATGCTLLLVNQLRDNPGALYGNPTHPTGGQAVGFFAALRLQTDCAGLLYAGREIVGQEVLIRVPKNNLAPPGKRAAVRLIYGEGLKI